MPFLDVGEHEVDVDEICLQAQGADKLERTVHPLRGAAEDAVDQQDACHGERYVEHSLQKQGEVPVLHLFQEDAGQQGHQKHNPYHPDTRAVECVLSAYHLPHVDADEEDGHATPEYLQVSHGLVDGGDIFREDAPHDHHHGQPLVDGMPLDEFHVGRGEEVEHHGGRDVPEVELVVQPEPPVDGDFPEEVYPAPGASTVEAGNIEEAGDDDPGGIDAQVTADEEAFDIGILHPGEPQADATEEEEHINPHIAHPSQAVEGVLTGQGYVEEDDEEHRGPHQLTAEAADVRQFYIFDFHKIEFNS